MYFLSKTVALSLSLYYYHYYYYYCCYNQSHYAPDV